MTDDKYLAKKKIYIYIYISKFQYHKLGEHQKHENLI